MYLVSGLAFAALVAAGIQISPLVSLNNSVPIIGYCSVPGYPAAPKAGMALWLKADSYSPCSATSESTWADSSGNSNTATFTSGTFTCDSNQINGHNALTIAGATPKATLATTLSTPQTAFVVYKIASYTASHDYAIFGSTAPFSMEWRVTSNSGPTGATQMILRENIAVDMSGTLNITAGAWHKLTFSNAPSGASNTNSIRLDNALDNQNLGSFVGFGGGPNVLFLNGASNTEYFAGQIAEILYYGPSGGVSLSAADVTYNDCYLYGELAI